MPPPRPRHERRAVPGRRPKGAPVSLDPLDDPVGWAAGQVLADPVRRRVADALARRAAAQPPGPLRERLVGRLVERLGAGVDAAEAPAPSPHPSPHPAANRLSALTQLVVGLQAGAGPELRNVQAHRRTWTALRLARRMAEVSAPVPEQLGPLNSQVLVSRALQQLKALSPDYLQRLLTQLDTLAALAPLQAAAEPEARPARKAAGRRR